MADGCRGAGEDGNHPLGERMITETIVTTVDASGRPNFAPMGVTIQPPTILIRPYRDTATFRNLAATGAAVVHLTDNARLFAESAIGHPQFPASSAECVPGVVLRDTCTYYECRVVEAETAGERARFACRIVKEGRLRDFTGFNRAKHAVLEAAILATRVPFLGADRILRDFVPLAEVVRKTAGPEETAAMRLLEEHVRSARPRAVTVRASARLHLGLIDLPEGPDRRFASLGVALDAPALVLEVSRGDELTATGELEPRLLAWAESFLDHYQNKAGARLELKRALPAHVGLGSGTQLALAVAAGLARLFGIEASIRALANVMGRGRRSGVGIAAFEAGGLAVEASPLPGGVPASLLRHAVPDDWTFVVVVPQGTHGLSGATEEEAFRRLSPAPEDEVDLLCRLVLADLVPSLIERDLGTFGETLTRIQEIVGRRFQAFQSGTYATELSADLLKAMAKAGAAGWGQSSWGPTVFALVGDPGAADAVEGAARAVLAGRAEGTIYRSRVRNSGAEIVTTW